MLSIRRDDGEATGCGQRGITCPSPATCLPQTEPDRQGTCRYLPTTTSHPAAYRRYTVPPAWPTPPHTLPMLDGEATHPPQLHAIAW